MYFGCITINKLKQLIQVDFMYYIRRFHTVKCISDFYTEKYYYLTNNVPTCCC